MDDVKRELRREKQKRRKYLNLGIDDPRCPICGEDDVLCLELDHVAGKAHDDQRWCICKNCHAKRTAWQKDHPEGSVDPKNPLDVIGRWLLGMADYFEMLVRNLRRFGEYFISCARDGYGEDFPRLQA